MKVIPLQLSILFCFHIRSLSFYIAYRFLHLAIVQSRSLCRSPGCTEVNEVFIQQEGEDETK